MKIESGIPSEFGDKDVFIFPEDVRSTPDICGDGYLYFLRNFPKGEMYSVCRLKLMEDGGALEWREKLQKIRDRKLKKISGILS